MGKPPTDAELGLSNEPAFENAKATRTAGVLIFSLSMGSALILALLSPISPSDRQAALGYGALGSVIGSLAIGLPIWINGQSRVSAIRRERRARFIPVLAASPNGAAVGAGWQF